MLVLTRKQKEEIHIGNNVTITILRIKGQSVRVGISAPKNIRVVRGELGVELPALEASETPERVETHSAEATQTIDQTPPSNPLCVRRPAKSAPDCHPCGARSLPPAPALTSSTLAQLARLKVARLRAH